MFNLAIFTITGGFNTHQKSEDNAFSDHIRLEICGMFSRETLIKVHSLSLNYNVICPLPHSMRYVCRKYNNGHSMFSNLPLFSKHSKHKDCITSKV